MKPKNESAQTPSHKEENTHKKKGKLLFHPAYRKSFSDSSKTNGDKRSQKRRTGSSSKDGKSQPPKEYSKIRMQEDYIYLIQSLLF
ncbi:hypothetical protein CH375_04635 [Leptospira ellisii]|uniref:Uncharacterized protein n=1 Tax=Leptospira ellisii TaxID=2023197 RepID=A0A2N0BNG3_9LEPT|nr:hypothetical protein CH379_02940 [Leptospira ellisii]PKA05530.1 hypothetical protein CH375_04635 [Leptospira ellisii]